MSDRCPTSPNRLFLGIIATILLTSGGCGPKREARDASGSGPTPVVGFSDVTGEAGISHVHRKPRLDPKLDNIQEWVSSVGAAAAAGDFDGDGWIDLYVTTSDKGSPNLLYRNRGDGTFSDVAGAAGVAHVNDDGGTSMDCVWGDYDNDGWIDLYVVRWGRDRLFRNRGDGTFEETTEKCFTRRDGTPGTDWANGNAAVFLDYDLDGRLDLYVGNYFQEVDLWNLETTRIMHGDFENARDGGRNFLFLQETEGRFREVAESLGVDDCGWTLDVGSADVDNDGRPDLYVANDFGPDQLFLNDPELGFDNVSESALGFDTKKGMNVSFGDFDNDGWLDAYVTNITTSEYLQEGNMLWHNDGPGDFGLVEFADVAERAGTWDGGWAWGAHFFDADLDGDLDIVSVNGFISGGEGDYWLDLASWTVLDKDPADSRNWPPISGRSFSGYEKKRFWRSDGNMVFREMAQEVGLTTTHDGRGVVCFDFDNDGDLDLYFANQGQPPNLYRNDVSGGHWLEVRLATDPTTRVNRDAIGARVTVVTERGAQIRERDGGNGYCGQNDPRLHFGLGTESRIRLVEVRWPDGGYQIVDSPAADRLLEIHQNPSGYAPGPAVIVAPPARMRLHPVATATATIDENRLESDLKTMEAMMRSSLNSYAAGTAYRSLCGAHGLHDRSIAFFESLVRDRPKDARARIELALAHVDKIPACGGLAAIVSKGTLARRSLDQLDRVLADEGDSWTVRYCRGTNHLYWPRALRHSDDAAADFRRCVEIQRQAEAPAAKPHFERAHVGLGDALAKDGRYEEARVAWREGLLAFPSSSDLRERLVERTDAELLAFVESRRNLQNPIDTDLSFLDP